METRTREMEENDYSYKIIGAAIEVHKHLGPGLLESAYKRCLCRELTLQGIPFERQVPLPLEYKGEFIDSSYQLDVVVDGIVVVELKSVACLEPIHEAQLITYLKLSKIRLGLLINFNESILTAGVKRRRV